MDLDLLQPVKLAQQVKKALSKGDRVTFLQAVEKGSECFESLSINGELPMKPTLPVRPHSSASKGWR
jgi:hypothetical protein